MLLFFVNLIIFLSQSTNSAKDQVKHKPPSISSEIAFKSTQTAESSFVPCDSCAKIQTNLKNNADQLINMCHYQGIQSRVGKYRASLLSDQILGGWLSGSELEKWLEEQDKDLERISKQLEFLGKNNSLIKTKLEEKESELDRANKAKETLRKEAKDLGEEKVVLMKQYEKRLMEQKLEMESKIGKLEKEIGSLGDLKKSLDEKYENLKKLYENNENIIAELTETNRLVSEELAIRVGERERADRVESEMVGTRKEIECLKRELAEKSGQISSERTKLEEMIRSQEVRVKNKLILMT